MSDLVLSTDPAPAPGAALGGLAIRLFGPMEVRIGSRPLPRLRSRKGLWLLALLALRAGRPVERDWLAGTLWPECDEAHARRNLRQNLHNLRVALGPEAWRLADDAPRTLRLDVGGASVDALAFDAAIARGDIESLEAAVLQYRGPLLEDCGEAWCLEERRQREEGYLAALERLAAAAMASREPAAAARSLRQALAVDPYREELQRALMEALAASGSPAAALLAYRQFRALLGREMPAEPAAETTALFRRLREETRRRARPPAPGTETALAGRVSEIRKEEADPAPGARRPAPRPPLRRLPLPLTALIGRQEAAREVIARLADARLVTLTGTGGIGKTRLALQVAEQLAEEYADGAAFVDLAPLAAPAAVPEACRTALGMPPGDGRQETVEALRQYLSERHLLLVLDNCEHLLGACAALAETLLAHCPGLRVLATSRQPLDTRGEIIWRVPPLPIPVEGCGLRVESATERDRSNLSTLNSQLSALREYAAVRLFLERARAAELSFEMTPHNAPAIARICARLDGIPLAIELAAARVRSVPVAVIDERLRDGFGLLKVRAPALLPRHQTMAATFDWSWGLLSPAEQALLRRLSVFAGGWTLEAAEAVCSEDRDEVLDLLTALVDRSMVLYLPAGAGEPITAGTESEGRYRLLEPVRQYAADRLCESGEGEAAQNRHRDFFLEWAEAIHLKLRGPEQELWFHRLEVEHDNLRAALEWCRSHGDVENEVRMVRALSRFWDTRGHLREGRAHLDAALARMTPALPYSLRASALGCGGWIAGVQGDYAAARVYFGQSLVIFREHGDRAEIAGTLNVLAMVFAAEADFAAARASFEESLALHRELGRSVHAVLNNLGELALRQADYEAARSYLEESVPACEGIGNRQEQGLALMNLSITDWHQARYAEARVHGIAALRLLHACGAVVNIPPVLEQIARVAQAQAEAGRAARLLGAAQRLRETAGLPPATSAEHANGVAAARQALGAEAFAAAFAEGRAMGLEQALACALDETGERRPGV